MSGSKNSSTSVSGDGGEVVGAAILAALAIPVGAAILTYYAGKVLVKGTVAGGKLAAKGVERYQEYQRQQNEIRLQRLENRRIEECNKLRSQMNQATQYCNQVSQLPFMNDSWAARAIDDVNQIVSQFSSSLPLEKALELSQSLDKAVKVISTRQDAAVSSQQERSELLAQMEQTRKMIQSQSDVPSEPELAKLKEFQNRINSSTIETFPVIKADVSNWTIDLMNRIKSVQEIVKARSVISSLWNSLPVSPELAKKYDLAGYSELKRIESFIFSASQPGALSRFQNAFEQHKAAVKVKMRQEAELEAEREMNRRKFEPKLDELTQRLELADNEIVKRWSGNVLSNLRRTLETFKTNLAQGLFQTMESDIESWNEAYTNMLTQAGLKQQAEERRQYIVDAMKMELPKLGFDIQSLSSKSDAASDTVIKVVPHTQNSGQRRRITITVPQAANELVNYKFDGYDVKHNRIEGRPVVENDTGKQTVMDIAAALKPYGILISDPDWGGNPDKIRKNADSIPDDSNPAEELERTQSAGQHRALDLD
ncbi:MAG: hypothetical protein IKX40_09900 [Thermoguttaceae bacterium]|nr:hypothetical protein [Thermoguttaceae bacterium]